MQNLTEHCLNGIEDGEKEEYGCNFIECNYKYTVLNKNTLTYNIYNEHINSDYCEYISAANCLNYTSKTFIPEYGYVAKCAFLPGEVILENDLIKKIYKVHE